MAGEIHLRLTFEGTRQMDLLIPAGRRQLLCLACPRLDRVATYSAWRRLYHRQRCPAESGVGPSHEPAPAEHGARYHNLDGLAADMRAAQRSEAPLSKIRCSSRSCSGSRRCGLSGAGRRARGRCRTEKEHRNIQAKKEERQSR